MAIFSLRPADYPLPKRDEPPEHYHGDRVRRLFLLGGAIMIFSYPFFRDLINVSVYVAIALTLAIALFAGIQSPRHRWTSLLNTLVSTIAFCAFEYKAAMFYLSPAYATHRTFFWLNEILAAIFFFAIYFSAKSLRAAEVKPKAV